MKSISKSEMEFMINNNILKCVHGQYPGLTVTSKRKRSNGKQRQIEEPMYFKMLELQNKLKVEKVEQK